MNKFLILGLSVFLLLGVASAIYIVNSLTLTVGVAEPFVVSYAVLGDAGTYTEGDCESATDWFTSTDTNIPTGDFFPLEQRYVCVRIQNLGEVAIPYVISANVVNDNPDGDCANAFGLPNSLIGSATESTNTYDGVVVQIGADATPVTGCEVQIEVARGTI